MRKVGRNEPCPCGSGKKYKKCCEPTVQSSTPTAGAASLNKATDFLKVFRDSIGDHAFESEIELRQAITAFKDDFNSRPLPDFLGLNAEQMHRISTQPIEALTDLVCLCFADREKLHLSAPVIHMAISIMLHIRTANGLELTEKGNLPLQVVTEMHDHMPHLYELITASLQSEENLPDLFIVRNLLEMADVTVQRQGRLELTGLGSELLNEILSEKKTARLYRQLFLVYTNRFNWLLFTCYEKPFAFIQHTALFDLFILQQKAVDGVDEMALAKAWSTAFPSLGEKLGRMNLVLPPLTPNERVHDAFCDVFIHRYCWLFNLLEQQEDAQTGALKYRTTELFRETFDWQI
ncbi:MAG: SEC-C domain-containing protein [Deltaproteobacteria bacterium]|nr:SEC-C domain-containing protein [Deltaproteobacteria bacterium]